MLFNSPEFAFVFFPAVYLLFRLLARFRRAWLVNSLLVGASLAFYAYWMPSALFILLGSILFNYFCGLRILARVGAGRSAGGWVALGVTGDLVLLSIFKYAGFFAQSVNDVFSVGLPVPHILLPIGISFFTFTQIAFLVDAAAGKVKECRFLEYLLFVTYFPHLIAGPILHHAEMMPQFAKEETYRVRGEVIASGAILVALGLIKKVLLSDGIQPYAAVLFDQQYAAAPSALVSWMGAIAYSLQLYFDFSGYSDMAVGISLLFGVKLPFNFDSPYKARNIVDFWRRWHISLSSFLRDYLYIALGGNRRGKARRYVNLMLTMLLGGLWHGAAWTFVIWGGLHGAYLMLNHAWRAAKDGPLKGAAPLFRSRAYAVAAWALTMAAVVVAWVFFRASRVEVALEILKGMAGANGLGSAADYLRCGYVQACVDAPAVGGLRQLGLTAALLLIAVALPNSIAISEYVRGHFSGLNRGLGWRAAFIVGAVVPLCAFAVFLTSARGVSEFIYFNF
ncbi:MBOAT family O-acyltransferase [Derxia lacustris]|uniref:MBOAT family O-acyltransferase n=1 Tax=Derxia lacustris TaxID=764842 RepID=UPI000A16CD80|nr:MBOAT family O-acyltransferase [Derxia lacustris]